MTKKWGESFLKSGLPLEHVTAVTLRSLDWHVAPHFEYERPGSDAPRLFEVDLVAETKYASGGTDLHLLIECKYHDSSRFWFFHPLETERGTSDGMVLNPAPFQTLRDPAAKNMIGLAPASYWGVVVSEDGQKQDNAIHTAIEQLAHAFVPYVTYRLIDLPYGPSTEGILASCVVPLIVTNASIFRLRPEVTDLAEIRDAADPSDIADEVAWTWCFNEPSEELIRYNEEALKDLEESDRKTQTLAAEQMRSFLIRPAWFAVTTLDALEMCTGDIRDTFFDLRILDGIIRPV